MNYQGLKQAARQCLRDSACRPWRLTLLFLLCAYAATVAADAVSLVLELRLLRASGLASVSLRRQMELWTFGSLIVVLLLQVLWNAGYARFTLHLSRQQSAGFHDFPAGFRQPGRVLALALLEGLYIWLWCLLFIIPGLVAAYRYRMALFALLDDPDCTASEALRVSTRLTYGHKLELLQLDLRFFWYHIPSILAMALLRVYEWGLTPYLQGNRGRITVYLVNLLLPLAMEVAALLYVQTTQAHAYNWLLSLDRRRQEELHQYGTAGPVWE